ncbi:unnamed protein product [Diatraea saccharalis]|uniref:Calpain catalytic domain-containing protein n=1 Tax=Diatraea saccharalis TaxID=40085 RepID=A0A9N9R2X0_9NEOP|nr:unnamed protein product [Diatraea saccharalis]
MERGGGRVRQRSAVRGGERAVADAAAAGPRRAAAALPPRVQRRLQFWVFGEWREVAVDDRLPTRGGRPLYSRGALPGDFTLPLLEKAYAKQVCVDVFLRRPFCNFGGDFVLSSVLWGAY